MKKPSKTMKIKKWICVCDDSGISTVEKLNIFNENVKKNLPSLNLRNEVQCYKTRLNIVQIDFTRYYQNQCLIISVLVKNCLMLSPMSFIKVRRYF